MTITRLAQFTAEDRILTNFSHFAATPSISAAFAKTGTYAYKFDYNQGGITKVLPATITEGRMGFWMHMDSLDIDETSIVAYIGNGQAEDWSANVNHLAVVVNTATGLLSLIKPNGSGTWVTLASAVIPSQFTTALTWFHVGVTCKIDATTGYFSVYINGNLVVNYVGDTCPTNWNGGGITTLTYASYWGGPGGTSDSGLTGYDNMHMDDFFIDNMDGEGDSVVPSRRFLMVLPTAAGVEAEWTPVPTVANYLNVDENPHDGDATYNKALAADLRDTFVMGDITLPVDHVIVAVIPSVFAKRLDAEAANSISVHAWDGLQYVDSADLDLSMSYDSPAFARLPLQPDGSAWNETDFNAMQFGYQSRGTF